MDEPDVIQEVEEGRSPATPFPALGGTAIVIMVAVALVIGIAALAYLFA